MGKYSVPMSVYHKENPDFFRQSVESMLNQTVMPDEIVVVKDGPLTDSLEMVINDFVEQHPDILKVVSIEKNVGLGVALNVGLQHCRNELVARMDTDDVSVPERCEKQLRAFYDNPELAVFGGAIAEFTQSIEDVIGIRPVPTCDSAIKRLIKRRCPFNHQTVMFRKSEVLRAGGYVDWFWNEDYYLWVRMSEMGCRFGNSSDVLVYVRSGIDQYRRRGGLRYFQSEAKLQRYLLEHNIVSRFEYLENVAIRLVVQLLMPSWLRGVFYRCVARTQAGVGSS
jgi:glycosyltransferase involved in cell wall biosynthesis